MANRKIGVEIDFSANTEKAKQQIVDLQKQLSSIQVKPGALFDDVSLKKASSAAAELQRHLKAATDVNTGKLDLSKFSVSLKQSQKTLTDYKKDLIQIGPEGRKAFMSLASAVASAEVPTLKLNKMFKELGTTLKNTIRWQISSNVINTFVGAVQTAYYYAKDLDKSLNNIRIVTKQSTEQMTQFAKEANKAAQSLSTTTLDYTNASLIYYQQGLGDEEVKARTDVTVKMANVTRQAAEDVSNQMTAVWNNFADGSKSLEYYADVMTGLGAATASSSAEIAEGLSKFASVADTVGLSFEYATAALATVTATTRQSADIVGNAFKTLFGRLESLKLGETLEDGTDFGKYSEALLKVGINIKDELGNLKSMNEILDEMGAKWNTLGKDQQMALAQSVGGVRQYTQLVALMENYDKFQKNVGIAKSSEGELQKQQKVYEEGWEAATKRVRAAIEEVYKELVDSKFFIKFSEALENTIHIVDGVIKSLGGLKGILLGISAIVTQKFAKEIPNTLNEFSRSIKVMFKGKDYANNMYAELSKSLNYDKTGDKSELPYSEVLKKQNLEDILRLKEDLIKKEEELTEKEKEEYEEIIRQKQELGETLVLRQQEIEMEQQKINISVSGLAKRISSTSGKDKGQVQEVINDYLAQVKYLGYLKKSIEEVDKQSEEWFNDSEIGTQKLIEKIKEYIKSLKSADALNLSIDDTAIDEFIKKLEVSHGSQDKILNKFKEFISNNYKVQLSEESNPVNIKEATNSINNTKEGIKNQFGFTKEQIKSFDEVTEKTEELTSKEYDNAAAIQYNKKHTEELLQVQHRFTEDIGLLTSGFMSLGQLLASMTRISDVFSDEDATALEKIIALTTGLGMAINSVVNITKAWQAAERIGATISAGYNAVKAAGITLDKKRAVEKAKNISLEKTEQALTEKGIAKDTAATVVKAAKLIVEYPLVGFGIAAAALGLIGLGIGAAVSSTNKKKAKEDASELHEKNQEAKNTSSSNKELIVKVQEELKTYSVSGGNKEKLDEATRELAEAYNIQGDALARLTGQYSDYNKVLEEAKKLAEEENQKRLANLKKENEKYIEAGEIDTSFYFQGSANASTDKNFNRDAIIEELFGEFITKTTNRGYNADSKATYYLDFENNIEKLISYYTSTMEKYNDLLVNPNNYSDEQKKVITEAYKNFEKDTEYYDQVKENLLEQEKIEGLFFKSKNNKSINDISDYSQFDTWKEELVTNLSNKGYSEDIIESIIVDIINNSFNSKKLNEFSDRSKAIKDFQEKASGKLSTENIENLVDKLGDIDSGYNAALVSFIDWSSITDSNFNQMIDKANQYAIALAGIQEAETKLVDLEQLLKIAQQDTFSKEDFDFLQGQGINIEDFLSQSKEERTKNIQNQIGQTRAEENKDAQTAVDYNKSEIERLEDRLAQLYRTKQVYSNRKFATEEEKTAKLSEINGQISDTENELAKQQAAFESNKKQLEKITNYNVTQAKNLNDVSKLEKAGASEKQIQIAINNALKEQAKKYGLDDKVIATRAKKLAEQYKISNVQASKLALQIERTSKGLKELVKNSDTWLENLKDSSNPEYYSTLTNLKETFADIFDTDSENISEKFLLNNINLIQQISDGSEDALKKMHELFMQDYEFNVLGLEKLTSLDEGIRNTLDLINNNSFEIGVNINDEEFIAGCNHLIETANWSATEVSKAFGRMGYDVEISYVKKFTTTPKYNEDGTIDLKDTVIMVPVIKTISKSSSFGGNYIDIPPKSSGGGKQSKKEHSDEKADRYWTINNAIKKLNNTLEKYAAQLQTLQTMQSHLFGQELIDNLKKQNAIIGWRNKLLEKQKANYEKLYEMQKKELAEIEKKLQGYGGTFTGDVMSNYWKTWHKGQAEYDKAVDDWNKNHDDEAFARAQKRWETLKEELERYRTLYLDEMAESERTLEELAQQELENKLQILANNLQMWEITVKAKLDLTEAKRNLDKFLKEVEQDFRKVYQDLTIDSKFNAEAFATYKDDIQTTLDAIKDVEAEIDKINAGGESDKFASVSEAQEKLKELQQQLLDQAELLNQMYQEVWNNYIDGLNQIKDKFDDIIKQYERIGDELNYERELVELLYGDKAYDLMNKFYDAQQKNILGQIDSMKQQMSFWESEFKKAYEMNRAEHNVDMNDMSTWTEDMKIAYDNMQDAQSSLNSLILEGVKNLQEDYMNAINKVLSTMDSNVWRMSFDDMKEDWDHIQNLAGEYLDDVEGAYRIQTLANKIDQSIASSLNTKAQQKLQDLREKEIKMLREKENLTQDDIDLAEQRYQIALKEIALEEAQNSKTSMKLTRDTSGNWTYQYVADETDVLKKQQDLLDAYNNLYETADKAYNHAMELAMNAYQEMQEKIREIAEDMTLSEEEKEQKIQAIYDKYLPEIEAAVGNSEVYRQEAMMASAQLFSELCEQDSDAYESLTQVQKDLVDSLKEHNISDYEELRDAIIDGYYPDLRSKAEEVFGDMNLNSQTAAAQVISDWAKDNGNSVRGMLKAALYDLTNQIRIYESELDKLQRIAEVDFDKIGKAIDITSQKTENMRDQTQNMCETAEGYLEDLRDAVNNVTTAWEEMIKKIQDAIRELEEYIRTKQEVDNTDSDDSGDSSDDNGGDDSGGGTGGGGGDTSKEIKIGDSGTLGWGAVTNDQNGGKPWGTQWIGSRVQVNHIGGVDTTKYGKYYVHIKNGNGDLGWIMPEQLKKFDTGGYTGSWDSSGKLAMLHQKELVLNASDTVNMLKTVEAVRDLGHLSSSIDAAIAGSLGNLVASMIAGRGYSTNTNTSSNSENVFNITAEFPNANDVDSIREAILSLPNLASQYLNEK